MAIPSTELTLLNELAKVCATQHEWLSIADIVAEHIRDAEFSAQYAGMSAEVAQCYALVGSLFEPFVAIASPERFEQQFERLRDDYQKVHLHEISKARHAADRAFEFFIVLSQRREFKTGYPLLKRTFDRLDYFVDKYVTNDAWLVMSIDVMIRRMSRFLQEVTDLKKSDSEEAFQVYRALMKGIERFLVLLAAFAQPVSEGDELSLVSSVA